MDWNSQRLAAIARLVAMLVAMVAGGFGLAVDADSMATVLIVVLAAAAAVWSWWSNNNVTQAAQDAQRFLDELKRKGE